MKFDTPAGPNPIDRMKVVGRAARRIDGPLKITGAAPYAYERHDVVANQAYGYMLGSAIAKGRIKRIDTVDAERAPGVIKVVTAANAGPFATSRSNTARLLAGPEIQHYHQAIALVVAETFEQARAAAALIRVDYARAEGRYDLAAQEDSAPLVGGSNGEERDSGELRTGDFEGAFAAAPVRLDATYTTPDQSHQMMEPHASIAAWSGDELTLWTSTQMVAWAVRDLSQTFLIPQSNIQVLSPYVGGGFGAKLRIRADAVLAALGARAVGRPVKLAITRPQTMNNSVHRPATIQRIRIGCDRDGRITAIAHESVGGDLEGGRPATVTAQTRLLYAGANRLTSMRQAVLDLPEGNSMRAPGAAGGMMALEIAMDEMAEKLRLDPVEFRIRNDTQVDPEKPEKRFSERQLVRCLREGAKTFGWSRRAVRPAQRRDGNWWVGLGVSSAFHNSPAMKSAARVRLEPSGRILVETDMTDIGTGSYTIIAQTAAEMLGLPLDMIDVRLGDSRFPVAAGSGGQFGAANATSGVYAACVKLREAVARQLGMSVDGARFESGYVVADGRRVRLADVSRAGALSGEDAIEYGDMSRSVHLATFGAHFVEAAVHAYTGEIRVRRMLAVCAAGRIINPVSARSQVIGAMTMGVGAALMEEMAVDKRFGFFVNHDLAGYEVPVHADIPHQEVVFLDEADEMANPMKAKGVGELGITGVGAAVANAVYNACGVRVRDYPITLDKYLDRLPPLA
ncbi:MULTISPECIES: aldehyde oxidoreductase molybdenum-binding subunit PaoC [unclassified Sphingomonas]|uniref:aldehyde oxidoreductase molybdenum-binding subunit PaoC n=1 Tax=unclassified Sphingomonas TaxID=196159 RepID=UPI002150C9A1|nr:MULTISPECIES: aldehyde oxidoreductase molybdenum-binding subunit PaoC [unclassified Sphingomonas]MCR5871202.1 xanthine dehydrogenase family protein molybdopterin-binding subunit [Sphingomonas sp. J344]UUY00488.1 xanthine dehydrogenase family protein molybdopterin-binding subunit [Sphingomonas sp. J315]